MVLTTQEGLMFLAVGNVIGALLALTVFSLTVISFPLVLDRDVDIVTAMITSIRTVTATCPSCWLGGRDRDPARAFGAPRLSRLIVTLRCWGMQPGIYTAVPSRRNRACRRPSPLFLSARRSFDLGAVDTPLLLDHGAPGTLSLRALRSIHRHAFGHAGRGVPPGARQWEDGCQSTARSPMPL